MDLSLLLQTLRYADFTLTVDVLSPEGAPWRGHTAFARVLVAETRPDTLVELGTHRGTSFFAFCEAVVHYALPTQCHAVDTWKGDPQAHFYDEEIYEEVQKRVADRYAAFAHLLRCSFDEALSRFDDSSIDILHIDGCHSYEAVRHDFDVWLPKVKPGGIILLHDTNEYQPTFGAHKVWDEIAPLAKERHLFRHSHGLGVWRKPGGAPLESPLLSALLGKDEVAATIADRFVSSIAEREVYRLQADHIEGLRHIRTLERDAAREEIGRLMRERDGLRAELAAEQERCAALRDECAFMRHSRSWQLTRPLRALTHFFRALRQDIPRS